MKRAFIIVALLASLFAGCQQSPKTDDRPNILLIVADDLGFSDLGSYGSEISTPTLDALAKRGVRFTSFYTAPTCSPTRAMLLSGTDHHLAGLGGMAEMMPASQRGKPGYEGFLNDQVWSFPAVLQDAGYRTYMAGKWHLGHKPKHSPPARGFGKSFALHDGGASHFADAWGLTPTMPDTHYTLNGETIMPAADFYSTRSFTRTISDWLTHDSAADTPFFAYVAYTAPHDPLHVEHGDIDAYKGVYDAGYAAIARARLERLKARGTIKGDIPLTLTQDDWDALSGAQKRTQARSMELYAAMVEDMDRDIGHLLDAINELGALENTIIVFLSDNGPAGVTLHFYGNLEEDFNNELDNMGRPGSFISYGPQWARVSAAPFSGMKGSVREGGIRTPLIIAGPGIAGGQTNASPTHVSDIAPTLLAMTGTALPRAADKLGMSGKALVSLLRGDTLSVRGDGIALGFEFMDRKAIRSGAWKAIYAEKTQQWTLFNLIDDPAELEDVASAHPDVTARLAADWQGYASRVGVVPIGLAGFPTLPKKSRTIPPMPQ